MQLSQLVVVGVALILGACARTPQLEPAPGAEIVQLNGTAATASSEGVTVTAAASGWPGAVDIEDVVTPMRVPIENRSDRAIRIRAIPSLHSYPTWAGATPHCRPTA